MKYVEISRVKPGMRLARSIFNEDGTIELLNKGSILTDRHIEMLNNLSVLAVMVESESIVDEAGDTPSTPSLNADTVEKAAKAQGVDFDVKGFKSELESIDRIIKEEVMTSIVNKNMVIHVLTGDGNVPIDKKHEEMIKETKQTFEKIRESNELDLKSVQENIEEALPDMIRNNDVLMRLSQLQQSDDYTFEHSFRVSILASMIGKWMGYDTKTLEELASSALLYDIGKMKIPEFILQSDAVNEDEFEVIKRHAQFGYNVLLKTQGVTPNIKYSALQHHERMDGSGYPLRLKSGQIHDFAKIIMVCDIFDAMTNDRPYRRRVSVFQAAEYLSWQSGVTLDSKVCYIFLSNLAEYFTGKQVLLSTGEIGRIIYVDVNFPTRPTVVVGEKVIDLVKDKELQILDLMGESSILSVGN